MRTDPARGGRTDADRGKPPVEHDDPLGAGEPVDGDVVLPPMLHRENDPAPRLPGAQVVVLLDLLEVGQLRAQVRREKRVVTAPQSVQGDDSVGGCYSVALTNNHQQADTGTKMIHLGKNTRSTSISKGISAGQGQQSYRGAVRMLAGAENARSKRRLAFGLEGPGGITTDHERGQERHRGNVDRRQVARLIAEVTAGTLPLSRREREQAWNHRRQHAIELGLGMPPRRF